MNSFKNIPDSQQQLLERIMILLPLVCSKPQMLGMNDILRYRRRKVRAKSYHRFEIPKRSGGRREILAPRDNLMFIQKAANTLLRDIYTPADEVHGFAPGRSVTTGAEKHVGERYVFSMDLQDFFPSITAPMVFESLIRELRLRPGVAGCICDLCTIPVEDGDDVLPQGSPASPILSNIVCARMDRRLKGLAECFGLTYTRYADDITFSGPYNAFKEGDAFRTCLDRIIREEGFSVNGAKTRLQKRGGRQQVTGLTVCEKVNVPRKWLKGLRAHIHRIEVKRFSPEEMEAAWGKVAWLRHVRGGQDPLSRKLTLRLCALEVARLNAGDADTPN
jgi:retron-type reverse transcriptase